MGKDRTGNFHPPKGKPSGVNKEEGLGLSKSIDPEQLPGDEQLTERDSEDEDQLSADSRIRHTNRNVNKGSSHRSKEKNRDKTTARGYQEEAIESAVPVEMPGIFNKELFKELAAYKSECCVTFFVQTHDSGVEVNEQKDNIKFKNSLQEVEQKLKNKGLEEGEIKGMLNPGYDLLRDDAFWKQQGKGIAVFLSKMYFRYIKMPVVPSEDIVIDKTFFVTPLVPLMANNDYFYLLVISKRQAKIFRVDSFGIQFLDIPGIPSGVEDVVHVEEKEDQKLFRAGGRGGNGGANFHG
ncbi:MAG TPA: hypothetical protein VLC28_06820, partial [Flavitalea sp.]|nr:hypothetical protein [Flavitalea sp.]